MPVKLVIYQFNKLEIVTACDYIRPNKKLSVPYSEEVKCFLQPQSLNLQAVKRPRPQRRLNEHSSQ